jgi:hypothetical protein
MGRPSLLLTELHFEEEPDVLSIGLRLGEEGGWTKEVLLSCYCRVRC